jgi:hypothetical protein
MGEELTGILTEGGAEQQSAIVELAMKGKNKAESSSSGVTYKCGVVKLERGMSVAKNGGAPGRFLSGRGGEPRHQKGVMAAGEVLFNNDGFLK